MKRYAARIALTGAWIGFSLGMSACNSEQGAGSARTLGSEAVSQVPVPLPGTGTGHSVGPSCEGAAICLALKYVVYKDSAGTPVVSQSEAISNLQSINQTWAQCGIAFQFEDLIEVNPVDVGLTFNTANTSELDPIRRTFDDNSTLLVVTTGKWNRSGTLGSTGANAWTNMPGSSALGSILESAVGTYPNIISHELGHYFSLGHVSDTADLMSPVIYSNSTTLTASQCNAAKTAISSYWRAMLR